MRKIPDVTGACVVCGRQATMLGRKFKDKGRIICSPDCGRALRGMRGRRTPMPDVECLRCGRTMKLPNLTHHKPTCWTTLSQFVELNAEHMSIEPGGCVSWKSIKGNRPSAAGWSNLARKILAVKLGRDLKPYPADTVCHTCDNGWCVNWWHLWAGTQAENMADMRAKGRQRLGPVVITDKHYSRVGRREGGRWATRLEL